MGEPRSRALATRPRALALALVVVAALLALLAPASGAASAETEAVAQPEAAAASPEAVALAEAAPAPTLTPREAREQLLARRRAEHEQLVAQHRRETQEIAAQRIAEWHRRLAERRRQHTHRSGTRTTPFGHVQISCSQIVWHFENFGPGSHTVTEIISVDRRRLGPVRFTFDGPTGENTTPLSLGNGTFNLDARASWGRVAGLSSTGWDIASLQEGCKEVEDSHPAFTIQKLEAIEPSGLVAGPLTGRVGQTVKYEILVTNLGPGTMVFFNLNDPHCDPGTLATTYHGTPVAAGEAIRYTCSHYLTPADQTAGSYANSAQVTGEPQVFGEQTPRTLESNTVLVTLKTKHQEEEERTKKGGGGEEGGNGGNGGNGGGSGGNGGGSGSPTNGSASTGTGQQVTIASAGPSPKLEALGVITSAPALLGRPEGCVRSSFVVSVKAHNVTSVTFYLDGHRLRTLTARSARKGRLSVRIQTSRLKPGVHRLSAKITMIRTAASAKPLTVTRSLRFARCASTRVDPRFTG